MKFCYSVHDLVLELRLSQNFCYTHTDRLTFSKSCQNVFRTSQNVQIHQNRKSKICTKPILFSIFIEESKNIVLVCRFLWCRMIKKQFFFNLLNVLVIESPIAGASSSIFSPSLNNALCTLTYWIVKKWKLILCLIYAHICLYCLHKLIRDYWIRELGKLKI